MSITYHYTRNALAAGSYDVDQYPGRATGLAEEVETAFPGKTFTIKCIDEDCDVTFDTALSGADKTTLDGVISDHQNNI